MIARLHSVLERLAPRARLVAIAATGVVGVNLGVSTTTMQSREHHRTSVPPAGLTPCTVTSPDGVQRQPSPASAADLAHAREAADRFLVGYLPFAYGRASARSVRALTSGLRRQLI